jgi:hypothetical protein
MSRQTRKGRSKGGERYVALPIYMLQCPAWRSLTPVERAVYVEASAFYNGSNNGWLGLGTRMLADRLRVSRTTASRALTALCDKGFLEITHFGTFNRKDHRASEYRLTLYQCDRDHRRASKEFMQWSKVEPERLHQKARTVTPQSLAKQSCRSRSHQKARGSPSKAPNGCTREPQISYHGGGAPVIAPTPIAEASASAARPKVAQASEREPYADLEPPWFLDRRPKARAGAA